MLVHEIGHAIGLDHKWKVQGCVMRIPATGPLSSVPCEFERQLIYFNYQLRQTAPLPTTSFISAVSVSPSTVTLAPGESVQLTATPLGGSAQALSGAGPDMAAMTTQNHALRWTTSNSAAGSLSSVTSNPTQFTANNVTGTQSTVVTVTMDEAEDVVWPSPTRSVNITVRPSVTSVVVSPGTATVPVNGSATFTAAAYSNGTLVPNEQFSWTVTGPGSISGSSTGTSVTVLGTAGGIVTVSARSSNNIVGQAIVTVDSQPDATFYVYGSWKNEKYFEFYAPAAADSYAWTFGDGTGTTVPYNFVTHTYNTCGRFRVWLTVTKDGQTASSSKWVDVCNAT